MLAHVTNRARGARGFDTIGGGVVFVEPGDDARCSTSPTIRRIEPGRRRARSRSRRCRQGRQGDAQAPRCAERGRGADAGRGAGAAAARADASCPSADCHPPSLSHVTVAHDADRTSRHAVPTAEPIYRPASLPSRLSRPTVPCRRSRRSRDPGRSTWTPGDYPLGVMLYAAHVLTLDGFGTGAEAALGGRRRARVSARCDPGRCISSEQPSPDRHAAPCWARPPTGGASWRCCGSTSPPCWSRERSAWLARRRTAAVFGAAFGALVCRRHAAQDDDATDDGAGGFTPATTDIRQGAGREPVGPGPGGSRPAAHRRHGSTVLRAGFAGRRSLSTTA